MKQAYLIRPKGLLTIVLGLIFLIVPDQVSSFLEADTGIIGNLYLQLFGLIALGAAWPMISSGPDVVLPFKDAINFVLWDLVAVWLVYSATNAGSLGDMGYLLAIIYGGSAILFASCAVIAKKTIT